MGTEDKGKDQEVKRSLRKVKREWANSIALEAVHAAKLAQMKGVYDATRKLCNKPLKNNAMVRGKNGHLLTKEKKGAAEVEGTLCGSVEQIGSRSNG